MGPDVHAPVLRCLIANESRQELDALTAIVLALGHDAVAAEIDPATVGSRTASLKPDVALVCPGESIEHTESMIGAIVHEAVCPVVLVGIPATQALDEVSQLGVFGYITADDDARTWNICLDIARGRFDDYHNLEGAFVRRAVIEQAKGILMERHRIDDAAAYEMLREQARSTNRKLVELAEAVVGGHPLLPRMAD